MNIYRSDRFLVSSQKLPIQWLSLRPLRNCGLQDFWGGERGSGINNNNMHTHTPTKDLCMDICIITFAIYKGGKADLTVQFVT